MAIPMTVLTGFQIRLCKHHNSFNILILLCTCPIADDDARFCVLLNDRLFLALDEFDFKVGRDYDADDD